VALLLGTGQKDGGLWVREMLCKIGRTLRCGEGGNEGITTQLVQNGLLTRSRDTRSNGSHAQIMRQNHNGLDQGTGLGLLFQLTHKESVDFEAIHGPGVHMTPGSIASAKITDHETEAQTPQLGKQFGSFLVAAA